MEKQYKKWNFDDVYNFYIEFNRIMGDILYSKQWAYYYYKDTINIPSKTWDTNDIVDLKDYNNVKSYINSILNIINSDISRLTISSQVNQVFNVEKANELEIKIKECLSHLGYKQWEYNKSGLTKTGNNLKLGGVL